MLLILSLCLLPMLLCLISRRRFELVIAPYACGLMLVCYALAVFKRLDWFEWMMYAATATALAWVVARFLRGERPAIFSKLMTPGLLCFAMLCAFYAWGNQLRIVQHTDDIYYWGIEVRSLFAHGGLVGAANHLSPRFMTYTPGMQVLEWVAVRAHGEWSEPVVFAALYIFYAALLMPLAERVTWRKAYWIPLFLAFAVGAPTALNIYAYTYLGVDTAQGLCMGLALCQIWALRDEKRRGGFELASLALSLCALVLIKQTGILWLMAALWLLLLVKPRKACHVPWGWLAAIVATPIVVYASWKAYCAVMGLSGAHLNSLSATLKQMLGGTYTPPEGIETLPRAIWLALSQPMQREISLLNLPTLVWMALFALTPLALSLRRGSRSLRRLSVWMLACDALAIVGFAFTYYTTMRGSVETDALAYWEFMQTLAERYLAPLMLGEAMLLAALAVRALSGASRIRLAAFGLATALAICLVCDWQSVYHNLVPDRYWADGHEREIDAMIDENTWVEYLDDPAEAIVLYGTDNEPYHTEWLQYAIAPSKLVLPPKGELTGEGFEKLLRRADVTHVVCVAENNPVYDIACEYVEDGELWDFTPYRVIWEDGKPRLYE